MYLTSNLPHHVHQLPQDCDALPRSLGFPINETADPCEYFSHRHYFLVDKEIAGNEYEYKSETAHGRTRTFRSTAQKA